MEERYRQSCSMPMATPEDFGTEAGSNPSADHHYDRAMKEITAHISTCRVS